MKLAQKAFTLIELIVVVGILSTLLGISLLAINPAKQFSSANDTQRRSNVKALLEAINQYQTDNVGRLPAGIDTNLRMIGSASSVDCAVSCGTGDTISGTSSLSEIMITIEQNFNEGSYSDTYYSSSNRIELNSQGITNNEGYYTTEVFDNGSEASWDSISWETSLPYYKAYLDNQQTEIDYSASTLSFPGNVLLYHNDTFRSNIADSSGNSNTGNLNGDISLSTGVFSNSYKFDGDSDHIFISNSSSLNLSSDDITLSAWIRWDIDPITGDAWANILNKNGDSEWGLQHSRNNDHIEFFVNTSNGRYYVAGATDIVQGTWYHVAGVYDGSRIYLYVNGVLDGTRTGTGNIISTYSNVYIGTNHAITRDFHGDIDEVAIFNRALSQQEVLEMYRRGSNRIKVQVRSCDDSNCSGEDFIGPDGTSSSYYSEINNTSVDLPEFSLSNVSNNQYFQARVYLETDNTYSPDLENLTISLTSLGTSSESLETESECLDLSSYLVPTYLADMPFDPKIGSEGMTYYAVRQTTNGRVEVLSCYPEAPEQVGVFR